MAKDLRRQDRACCMVDLWWAHPEMHVFASGVAAVIGRRPYVPAMDLAAPLLEVPKPDLGVQSFPRSLAKRICPKMLGSFHLCNMCFA